MKDFYDIAKEFFRDASLGALIAAIIGYLLKQYIERRWDGIEKAAQRRNELFDKQAEELRATSLALKQGLRTEERNELVAYRVALEKWQYFLETSLFDFSILDPAKVTIGTLYEEDKAAFLDVRIAIVRASTYLRNKGLEIQLMATVTDIRKLYYPIINEALPRLIDVRTQLAVIDDKMKRYAATGNLADAPTPQDQTMSHDLQEQLTAATRDFAERIKTAYPQIAAKLVDMKDAINVYIYRPVTAAAVDHD